MGKSKDVSTYPLWMFDVLTKLMEEPQWAARIECGSEREAKNVQLSWYGFRSAGFRSEAHTRRFPVLKSTTTRIAQEDGKFFLDIMHTDEAPDIKKWGDSLTFYKLPSR